MARARRSCSLLVVAAAGCLGSAFVAPGLARQPRARNLSRPALGDLNQAAFEASPLGLPIAFGQGILGLAALYAIMSLAEYTYHRYFQHLGVNKVDVVRSVRKTLQLSSFQGDGHVEHHRETNDDMTLDIEPGREVVLDLDNPYRGTSFPWDGTVKMTSAVMLLAYPTLSFLGWPGYVIIPVVVAALLLHALVWNALHPNMHGLPDVPLEVGAPSSVLAPLRGSPVFEFLRKNHEGHHRAVGAAGNYNVCCPGVDQLVGTNVDPVTGLPEPKPVPDWVLPVAALACAPLTPGIAVVCFAVLVSMPPLPRATAE